MVQSTDYSNKKLQEQEKICYICHKNGHSQYNCRERESVKGAGRKIIDQQLIEKPYLLNLVIEGVPNPAPGEVTFNLIEFGKVLLSPAKITFNQYEINRLHANNPDRDHEVTITFMDAVTKKKCWDYFYAIQEPKVTFAKETFSIRIREDLPAEVDAIYTKALKFRKSFDDVAVKINWSDRIEISRQKDTWLMESIKDIHKVRLTIDKMEREGIHNARGGNNSYYSRFLC